MRKFIFMPIIATIMAFSLIGCITPKSAEDKPNESTTIEATTTPSQEQTVVSPTMVAPTSPTKISAIDAKKMMDESKDLIILDVRTEEEFSTGHIKGAILIPDYDVKTKAEELLTDKTATILVYCRSGRRSALAAQVLSDLGYTTIYDFGGIIDWPYDVVKE